MERVWGSSSWLWLGWEVGRWLECPSGRAGELVRSVSVPISACEAAQEQAKEGPGSSTLSPGSTRTAAPGEGAAVPWESGERPLAQIRAQGGGSHDPKSQLPCQTLVSTRMTRGLPDSASALQLAAQRSAPGFSPGHSACRPAPRCACEGSK